MEKFSAPWFAPDGPDRTSIYYPGIRFYEYDVDGAAGSFTQVSGPTNLIDNTSGYKTFMLDLHDGGVLYSREDKQLYGYKPSDPPLNAGRPTIKNISRNADGTYHLTGIQLNGQSYGASLAPYQRPKVLRALVSS